jgi:Histidine phosphatase superfamily (branch 2)
MKGNTRTSSIAHPKSAEHLLRNSRRRRDSSYSPLFQLIMLSCAIFTIHRTWKHAIPVLAAVECSQANLQSTSIGSCRNSSTAKNPKEVQQKILYRRAVHLIHRHGDRTPITPLTNEDYWASLLISDATLEQLGSRTDFIRPEEDGKPAHNANGRGPFGKLTKLGMHQMKDLGVKLRRELSGLNDPFTDAQGRKFYPHISFSLSAANIRVRSTNFLRTIQSVQGLLLGLLPPNKTMEEKITVDLRHTDWIIPDPQPRRSPEQEVLEQVLSNRPHVLEREQELRPLAVSATQALHPLLAPDARLADFGIPQNVSQSVASSDVEPLSWNQLAEITKCLAVRGLLPDGITKKHQEQISRHAAWRWFESFRDEKLSYLAMNILTKSILNSLRKHKHSADRLIQEPPLTIWSAHDSTLICLMCAFRLEQPVHWPEYGSYLLIELLHAPEEAEQWVRFSLNGQVLRSMWNPQEEPQELIAVDKLWGYLEAQDAHSKAAGRAS